ncbi:MAG: Ig-like domain-containing protein, partial [Propionibacteriaceae bacterium]|nr:Ig-like domain-containing protein [Propionibacteriaceae bacterium]
SMSVTGSPLTLNFGQLPAGLCTMTKEPASGVEVGGSYTVKTVCVNDLGVPTHDLTVNHVTSDPELAFKAGSSCTTDATGTCSVQVTSTVADKTFTVDYATPPSARTAGNPVEVTFKAGRATASETRIVRNGAKNDGVERNQVDVVAKDQYGNLVVGAAVTATSPDSRITIILEGTPETGADGKYSTYYTSTTHDVDFPVSFTVGGLVPAGGDGSPVKLRFLQWELASVDLTVTPKVAGSPVPLTVGKDAANTYKLEGTASDSDGDPVAGAPILFRFVPPEGPTFFGGTYQCVTDAAGKCSVEAHSTKAGTYMAQAESGSVLSAAVGVTWVSDEVCGVECQPDPSTPPSLYTRVETVVDKQLADGQTADVVQLWAYDKWGNAVPNQLVTSTAPAGLSVMPNIPVTGDGTYGSTPGVSLIEYYSTIAWTDFKPDIRVGVTGKMREPRGNPPTLSFVAGPVCDTSVEITRNDALADGVAYDQVKVTGTDCQGNGTRGVAVEVTTADPVKPRVGVGNQATGTLGDDGTALFDLVALSTANVVDSPVQVTVADANGVQQPAVHYTDSLRTVVAPSPTALGDVGSSPALIEFRVLNAPVITGPGEGDFVADATPEITGTGEHPGAEVTVKDEKGDVVCKATVSGPQNTWSCTPGAPFGEGEHTIVATEKDPATGVDSPPSNEVHFTVDTVKPVVTVTKPADGAWVNNTTPWQVAGTVFEPDGATPVAGATVQVTNVGPLGTPGEKLCEAVSDANGKWTCDVAAGKPGPETAGNQSYTIRAVATDQAGNASDPADVKVVVKNVVDVKITDPKAGDVFNASAKPAGAAGVSITVSGTGESVGDVIEVNDGAGHACTTNVTANAVSTNPTRYAWSCELTDVPDSPLGGSTTLTVTETDKAGNKGTDSVPVLVDTVAPPAPSVNNPKPGTNISTTPTFDGTGDTPGDTITVKDGNGDTICVTTVKTDTDADGKHVWSCAVTTPLPEGNGRFDVTETDPAGNVSEPTHVETTVGGLPTPDITDVCNNAKSPTVCQPVDKPVSTNDNTPIIKGDVPGTQELPTAAVVEVTGPGGAVCTATIQPDRTWQCELPRLDDGKDIVIKVTVVDPNTGVKSEPDTVTITVDTVPPFIDVDTTDPGNIGVDTEPGSDVVIKNDDGKVICTATADASGHAVCHVADPGDTPKPGDTIHITVTDPAGNTSTKDVRIVKVTVADKEIGLPGETSQTAVGEYYQPGERVHGLDGSTDLGHQTADST